MPWKEFLTAWAQRFMDMLISVKVLLLIVLLIFVVKNIVISTTIATVITTILGIREGYKVVRSFNKSEGAERDRV